ncbi:MAG: hypothetical protein Rubg2KO_11350 [Rubricoccaceae bacterium]
MNPINNFCPRSGNAVQADSLTDYRGVTVGFCNPGCRDDFAAHLEDHPDDKRYFDVVLKESGHPTPHTL